MQVAASEPWPSAFVGSGAIGVVAERVFTAHLAEIHCLSRNFVSSCTRPYRVTEDICVLCTFYFATLSFTATVWRQVFTPVEGWQ